MNSYIPSAVQDKQLSLLLTLLGMCKERGIQMWVFGGYGLDALYGQLTRDHGDIDLCVRDEDLTSLEKLFEQLGFRKTQEKVGSVNKTVYRHSDVSAPFKLEFATVNQYKELLQRAGFIESIAALEADILPQSSLGTLRGISISTPTLSGFKAIIRFNNYFTKDPSMERYKHREWLESILQEIESKGVCD